MNLRSIVRTSPGGTLRRRLMVRLCIGSIVVLALVVSIASLALATTTSFPDVPASHQYYTAITDLASRSIIGGYASGSFGPADPVTRQQFAKMIVLAGGYPVSESDVCSFTDVAKSDATTFYPDNYVAVCAARGITTGKTPTTFDPTGKITRFQMVSMVVRMADNLQPGLLAAPSVGWTGNAIWASNATHGANAARAEYNGLLAGLDLSGLSPTGNMSRGEVAQVLYNLLRLLEGGSSPQPGGQTGQVTGVVDGDTIHVQLGSINESVRLIGMDAPEMGMDFSQQAKDALSGLVGGKTVRLETDVETRDQYGRLLAYVWVGSTMADAEMVRLGLATVYTVPPNVRYIDLMTAAQDEAKAAKRGIWGASSPSPIAIVSANYDAPGNDNFNLNEEYVTFRVLVSGSLIGYAVEDESGHRYNFPDRTFQAGQTFKLHTGQGTDTQTDLYWGATGSAIWNNNGDTVKVLDPQGHVVTSYKY